MSWLKVDRDKLEHEISEIVPRGLDGPQASVVKFAARASSIDRDNAEAALCMVSEAAEAIRRLEAESADAVARARSAAGSLMKRLNATQDRAERAEAAQRAAEAQLAELSAAALEARGEIEALKAALAAKDVDLALAEQRASHAEHRASEADLAIERIVDAIRTQLPVKAEAISSPTT